MDPDDIAIRPARPEEAELLSHLIFRARTYWDYPRELMDYWAERGDLSITPEEIEENPVYVAESADDVLGFYSIETAEDGSRLIGNLWVMPEYIGSEIPSALFFHACELAKTSGSDCLFMVCDPNAAVFYEEMGAERIGEKITGRQDGKNALPILRLRL